MAKKKTMNPINEKDYLVYLNYLLTGKVKNQEEADKINELSKRIITLSDAAILVKTLMLQLDDKLTQVMEVAQIQHIVLKKLGATEDMFKEAKEEYDKLIEETRKKLEEVAKATNDEETKNENEEKDEKTSK